MVVQNVLKRSVLNAKKGTSCGKISFAVPIAKLELSKTRNIKSVPHALLTARLAMKKVNALLAIIHMTREDWILSLSGVVLSQVTTRTIQE